MNQVQLTWLSKSRFGLWTARQGRAHQGDVGQALRQAALHEHRGKDLDGGLNQRGTERPKKCLKTEQ